MLVVSIAYRQATVGENRSANDCLLWEILIRRVAFRSTADYVHLALRA
ncbi:MAG: hypothetical protein LBU34_09785 [Planctomycetaceae bacterium]|nr:hypothetical protein [Planctomycetaceae bacterium]